MAMQNDGKRGVVIVQSQMKQYRLPFLTKLYEVLLQDGIELKVVYSDPSRIDKQKQDNVEPPPAIGTKVQQHSLWGHRIVYQRVLRQAARSDLVIAEQGNRYLHNYILLSLARMSRNGRLAFWGLGKNKDADRSRVSEVIRPWIARRADWWFTYTNGTAGWLRDVGFPAERITVLQNTTDTRALAAQIAAIPDQQVRQARERLGIASDSRIGIYCGILTADKGIAALLEAAQRIRERISNFHLLVLGGGPEKAAVAQAASRAPWIHHLGPRFGEEKALFLKMSDCFLLPGRTGLAILDSFASGLPFFTMNVAFHGPEIEYLENGLNGRMTESTVAAYAASVVEVLSYPLLLEQLTAGARASAERYSIEVMVNNCRQGILACLGAPEGVPSTVTGT